MQRNSAHGHSHFFNQVMEPKLKIDRALVLHQLFGRVASNFWVWQFMLFGLILVTLNLSSQGSFSESAVLVQTLLLIILPGMIAHWQGVRMSPLVEYSVVFIVVGTLLLGELAGFYEKLWWWDIPFHTFSGFFFAHTSQILLKARFGLAGWRNRLSVAVASILISIGLSGLWEVLEFTADTTLATRMQPSGDDTMYDIIAGALGALAIVFIR